MKRYNHILGSFAALALTACTGDFDTFNTNPDAAQTIDKKTYITTMEMDAVIPCSDITANMFQRACNLIGDAYAGYLSPIQAFNGGSYTCTYDLDGTDYNDSQFECTFTNVMPAWLNLKYAHQNNQITDDTFAIAEVIKVMAIQRTTDMYGPLPVSHFGEPNNPYESQQDIYANMFKDLNAAIEVLKEYTANAGNARPLEKVDLIYQGEYAKWLKLANSQKLRMAMRIRYADPQAAKTYAEEAVRDGVMSSTDDAAWLKSYNAVQVYNPLEEVWNAYMDTRMGATMDAYMNGYEDPRLAAYFKPCEDGLYHGVRSGIRSMLKANYLNLSQPNVAKDTPVVWFLASEVAFLRAEGAMLGWNMGGDDATLYNEGIKLSFMERGLSADAASTYAALTAEPVEFVDMSKDSSKHNAAKPSTITPRWETEASNEVKLERIITQKWIAMYPNGQEAWSEFRRTGYPKVIPIVDNMSGGKVSTTKQVRRMTFSRSEYSNNADGVAQAVELLGGPDTGNTKLWWDQK